MTDLAAIVARDAAGQPLDAFDYHAANGTAADWAMARIFVEETTADRRALLALLRETRDAWDRYVEATAGRGHEGRHDRLICPGFHDESHTEQQDCSACGGADYGTYDELRGLFAALDTEVPA